VEWRTLGRRLWNAFLALCTIGGLPEARAFLASCAQAVRHQGTLGAQVILALAVQVAFAPHAVSNGVDGCHPHC
jgi:hypothetical protein